jgi:hypothetical protein
MRDELYSAIYAKLMSRLTLDTPEEQLFIQELSHLATDGAEEFIHELEEALEHLQATVKRLSHVDN